MNTPKGCGVSEADLTRLMATAKEADRYAAKLECALERVRVAIGLIEDVDLRDLIEHLTRVKDDRSA